MRYEIGDTLMFIRTNFIVTIKEIDDEGKLYKLSWDSGAGSSGFWKETELNNRTVKLPPLMKALFAGEF
jgi:hypothetical protein